LISRKLLVLTFSPINFLTFTCHAITDYRFQINITIRTRSPVLHPRVVNRNRNKLSIRNFAHKS
jgi:hypothetical protein